LRLNLTLLKKKIVRIPLFVLCILGPVIAWLGFGRHGFIHLYGVEQERQAYIEKINKLTEENQALFEEIRRLRTDPKHVEMVARRELGLVRKNEVIYRFKDSNNPEKSYTEKVSGEKKPDELNKFPGGEVGKNGTIK
jgi:cell division protein FtsB